MSTFADSSAVVKLYADEDGQDIVRALENLVLAQIARVEVPAAIWRKTRAGQLGAASATVLVADFEADFFGTDDEPPRFASVALGVALLDDAAALSATRGLRAYDAIQLAAARGAAAADPTCRTFAAFDRSLRAAAAAEGFALIP
ncbi:MAG: type II toxin-antitoxin system VapC family toxin [Geodermatophilaceae bacterium]|nr:type II toxin-antitoxin system VapC family toxin [Geodermatophilaceae bacterium]